MLRSSSSAFLVAFRVISANFWTSTSISLFRSRRSASLRMISTRSFPFSFSIPFTLSLLISKSISFSVSWSSWSWSSSIIFSSPCDYSLGCNNWLNRYTLCRHRHTLTSHRHHCWSNHHWIMVHVHRLHHKGVLSRESLIVTIWRSNHTSSVNHWHSLNHWNSYSNWRFLFLFLIWILLLWIFWFCVTIGLPIFLFTFIFISWKECWAYNILINHDIQCIWFKL